jgi:hypothetical protein
MFNHIGAMAVIRNGWFLVYSGGLSRKGFFSRKAFFFAQSRQGANNMWVMKPF